MSRAILVDAERLISEASVSDTHLMSIALHEAGHAVALTVQGIDVTECWIDTVAGNGRTEHPEFDPNGAEASDLQKYAVACLAGWEAQIHHEPTLNPDAYANSIQSDLNKARSLIVCIPVSDEHREAIYDQCKRRARALIQENFAKVDKLAVALIERHRLSGPYIAELISKH
jgi:hypothetical protein